MTDTEIQAKAERLAQELDEGAVERVRDYISLDARGQARFTGREFERLGQAGDSDDVANKFTPADLTALALLGVPVSGAAALALLDETDTQWADQLQQIPPQLDPRTRSGRSQLTDRSSASYKLWQAVNSVPTMGPTRTGKLLARKRPRLLPVYDSVIEAAIAPGADWWKIIAAFFENAGWVDALEHVRAEAGAEGILSPLRTLDVVIWMKYRGPIEG